MKTYFFALFLVLAGSGVYSQINVGSKIGYAPHDIKNENLELLKRSNTVFLCRDAEEASRFEPALQKIWTITPIRCVPYTEFPNLDLSNTSVFSIFEIVNEGRQQLPSGRTITSSHVHLDLWMFKSGKEKDYNKITENNRITFAGYFLHENDSMNVEKRLSNTFKTKEGDLGWYYDVYEYYTWNIYQIGNVLKKIHDDLVANEVRTLMDYTDDEELAQLKNNKLYIPDYVLLKPSKWIAIAFGHHDPKKLLKSYPYDYEIVSRDKLDEMYLEGDKMFYFFSYINSGTEKYINVFNGRTGKLIYACYVPVSYNLHDKDFKAVAKSISKY